MWLRLGLLLVLVSTQITEATHDPKLCNKAYQCFVPFECRELIEGMGDRPDRMVFLLSYGSYVKTCDKFMIMIHAYDPTRAEITMVAATKQTQTINWGRKNKDTKEVAGDIVCRISENKTHAEAITGDGSGYRIKMIENSTNPLRCVFSIFGEIPKLNALQTTFTPLTGNFPVFEFRTDSGISIRCSPTWFKYSTADVQPKRVYRRVSYSIEKAVQCQHTHLATLEFRQSNTEKYRKADSIACGRFLGNKLEILTDGKPEPTIETQDPIEVRCSYDVDYFCNYAPLQEEGRTPMVVQLGDVNLEKKASLKCDKSHPYLVYGGSNKFLKKYDIECDAQGNDYVEGVWKIKTAEKIYSIYREGPPMFCTDKTECEKISEKAVVAGELSTSFPRCFEGGTMSVVYGNVTYLDVEWDTFRCDGMTGQLLFKPKEAAKELVITPTTKFTCKYKDLGKEQTEQLKSTITATTTAIALAGVIIMLILLIVTIILWYRRREINKLQAMAIDKAEWEAYGTPEEQADDVANVSQKLLMDEANAREAKKLKNRLYYACFKNYLKEVDLLNNTEIPKHLQEARAESKKILFIGYPELPKNTLDANEEDFSAESKLAYDTHPIVDLDMPKRSLGYDSFIRDELFENSVVMGKIETAISKYENPDGDEPAKD